MEKVIKIPKVKICGLTEEREAEFLNEAKADYAGFVFYEKSRRNVSFPKAESIMRKLSGKILKVAVTVSPAIEFVREIEKRNFDFLQVHGELSEEVRKKAVIPIFRAVNITDSSEAERFFQKEAGYGYLHICGYVLDGAGYGGGKTFDWESLGKNVRKLAGGKELMLAGGLNRENVRAGIRYFMPDAVDVSSGVEVNGKKDKKKIKDFIRKVREDGQ